MSPELRTTVLLQEELPSLNLPYDRRDAGQLKRVVNDWLKTWLRLSSDATRSLTCAIAP